jgi:hypothetical protein
LKKNFVATGRLSAVDGMGPSPIATAGAAEHFAAVRKMARLGTIKPGFDRTADTSVFDPGFVKRHKSNATRMTFFSSISESNVLSNWMSETAL